jgi:hypothetical protein
MVVQAISIPLASGDMALRYTKHRNEERRMFSDALQEEVERLFPEAVVVVYCGYCAPEVAADSDDEGRSACRAVRAAYNRVIDRAEW